MQKELLISVIVPVYNGGEDFCKCLRALRNSIYREYEIIVVDDCSTDDSAKTALDEGALVLRMEKQSGPAACRNLGAGMAKGDVLFFVDADVVVKDDTIGRIATDFLDEPDVAAVFGTYDAEPAEENFLSQYKNLLHHFIHQSSRTEAFTFWAGCGAIRREVFVAVRGFHASKYPKPSIEDIELGYRLRNREYRILIDKKLQVKHLKKWTWKSVLWADIFCRAIPWTKLILETGKMVDDLNLRKSQRISAFLVGLLTLDIAFSFFILQSILLVPLFVLIVFAANYKLFSFLAKQRGLKFGILAFLMHLLYFLYSGLVYVLYWLAYRILRPRRSMSHELQELNLDSMSYRVINSPKEDRP